MKRLKVPGLLAVTPMMGAINEQGQVVDSFPVGPEEIVDVVDIENDPSRNELTITSRTDGHSVSVGYNPAYAAGFMHAFGPRGDAEQN